MFKECRVTSRGERFSVNPRQFSCSKKVHLIHKACCMRQFAVVSCALVPASNQSLRWRSLALEIRSAMQTRADKTIPVSPRELTGMLLDIFWHNFLQRRLTLTVASIHVGPFPPKAFIECTICRYAHPVAYGQRCSRLARRIPAPIDLTRGQVPTTAVANLNHGERWFRAATEEKALSFWPGEFRVLSLRPPSSTRHLKRLCVASYKAGVSRVHGVPTCICPRNCDEDCVSNVLFQVGEVCDPRQEYVASLQDSYCCSSTLGPDALTPVVQHRNPHRSAPVEVVSLRFHRTAKR